MLVLVYAGFFMRASLVADRYSDGFVIDNCPVCQRGDLSVEKRTNRLIGIPRVKRTVQCNECRSVLREVGPQRWRYAIDRLENSGLYRRFNGRVIEEDTLKQLAGRLPDQPPQFIDEETS